MKKFLASLLIAMPLISWAEGIEVNNAWSRPSAAKVGAAFMEISNTGNQDDVLLSAQSDISMQVQVHKTTMDENHVMSMREMKDGMPLPAGQITTLKPGGLHIMLMGLKKPLKSGDRFPLQLNFSNSPTQTVEVTVQ